MIYPIRVIFMYRTNKRYIENISNMSKDELCELVESSPELLNSLTIEQLEELEKYYDEIIEELTEELEGM